MTKILLASFSIKIKDDGNDQHLSNFNGADDFLTLFQNFTTHIMQNVNQLRGLNNDHTIHLTLDQLPVVEMNNRFMYGYFSSGIGGERYKVINTETNVPALNVEPHHAAFRDVFFYLYVPANRNIGYLVLQRKAKFGIKTVLTGAIRSYMNTLGLQRYRFEIYNFLHGAVFRRMMDAGSLKQIDFIKRRIPNSLERYMRKENNIEEIPVILKTSFVSSTSLPHDWKAMLDNLFNQNNENHDRIEINNIDEQFDEVEFQLELNGKKKTFYVSQKHKIQPDIDVTNNVEVENGEPTTESMVAAARGIIDDILEINL